MTRPSSLFGSGGIGGDGISDPEGESGAEITLLRRLILIWGHPKEPNLTLNDGLRFFVRFGVSF